MPPEKGSPITFKMLKIFHLTFSRFFASGIHGGRNLGHGGLCVALLTQLALFRFEGDSPVESYATTALTVWRLIRFATIVNIIMPAQDWSTLLWTWRWQACPPLSSSTSISLPFIGFRQEMDSKCPPLPPFPSCPAKDGQTNRRTEGFLQSVIFLEGRRWPPCPCWHLCYSIETLLAGLIFLPFSLPQTFQ